MTERLDIAPMSLADLELALDWAADEGWNPGLDDATAFRAADPDGFLMGRVGSVPVAAISVVRHSASYGFLGCYLCRPEFRGHGYGFALWQAGMAHLGQRTVGLDGVVAQQENYRRSGFVLAHQTQRHEGRVAGKRHPQFTMATPDDLPALLKLDHSIQGAGRAGYLDAWFRQTQTRQTVIRRVTDGITAVGSIRTCRQGHKIGPLIAPDADTAQALVEHLAAIAGAESIVLDIPDPNVAGVSLAARLCLTSSFACARMYLGDRPKRDLARLFGESSFELG